MVYSVNRKIILFLFTDAFFIILSLGLKEIDKLVILTVGQLVLEILILYEKCGRLFCFPNIFLVLSYVLHMGNLMSVILFGYENKYIVSIENTVLINSICFFMLCHFLYTIGGVLANGRNVTFKGINSNVCLGLLERTGWISLLVGIVPRIYIDYKQISLQLKGGYLDALHNMTQYGIVGILALFFYAGVAILMYTSENHPIRARVILATVTIWEIITMLSGSRIYAISLIIVLFYLYFLKIKQPRAKTMILFCTGVIGISVIMTIISQIRDGGSFDISDIQNIISGDGGVQNPIIAFLAEMGSTMKSLAYSIKDFPSYNDYAYGKSYIYSLISAIPYIGDKLVDENYMVFIRNFKMNSYLGGSWIGEAYYNFSWGGCFFCLIVGMCISKVDCVLVDDESNNIIKLLCLTFLFYIVRYSRDYFCGFAQPIQVFLVLLAVLFVFKILCECPYTTES